MKSSERARPLVIAGGGVVLRDAERPLVAVVRLRKDKSWVLPKGKLKAGEDALAAARREVVEETGHEVVVHEFLGSMSHATDSSLKVVQFWRMSAADTPSRKLTNDVKAVKWLPLDEAVARLTRPHERAFLTQVGPEVLKAASQPGPSIATAAPARTTVIDAIRAWLQRITHMRA
jgi:8-oxo-dGTP diphosphatase